MKHAIFTILVYLALNTFVIPAAAEDALVTVKGNTEFISTGIKLKKGEPVEIIAAGSINYGSLGPEECRHTVTAKGCAAESICQVAGGCGALIGRIGGGAAFYIGESKVVSGKGLLELGINDPALGDNTGEFLVTISTGDGAIISGTILDESGEPARFVKVKANGEITRSTETGYDGTYSIEIPSKDLGTYTVTPSRAKSEFKPKNRRVKTLVGQTHEASFLKLCDEDFPKGGTYRDASGAFSLVYNCGTRIINFNWNGNIQCKGVDHTGSVRVDVIYVVKSPFGDKRFEDANYGALAGYRIKGKFTSRTKIQLNYLYNGPNDQELRCEYNPTVTLTRD